MGISLDIRSEIYFYGNAHAQSDVALQKQVH